MELATQVVRVGPVEQVRCVRLYSLISFVASASEVEIDAQEWLGGAQELVVHLYGNRLGILKVCLMVQQHYPELRVQLEALGEQANSLN